MLFLTSPMAFTGNPTTDPCPITPRPRLLPNAVYIIINFPIPDHVLPASE